MKEKQRRWNKNVQEIKMKKKRPSRLGLFVGVPLSGREKKRREEAAAAGTYFQEYDSLINPGRLDLKLQ